MNYEQKLNHDSWRVGVSREQRTSFAIREGEPLDTIQLSLACVYKQICPEFVFVFLAKNLF